MQIRRTICAALVAAAGSLSVATDADAAIIATAGRKAKLAASVRIVTNSRGQRQILITIDPGITTAFNIDVAYPAKLVQPDSDDGSGTLLPSAAIAYVPPYGAAGAGATIARDGTVTPPGIGVVNNVRGQYMGFGVPMPNRADGGSDLFTLTFDDLFPDRPKTFTILGVDAGGVDPAYASLIADNFLDAYVDDPNDPLNGQTLHFTGDQIESLTLVVPAAAKADTVPLPPGLAAGVIGATAIVASRYRNRRR